MLNNFYVIFSPHFSVVNASQLVYRNSIHMHCASAEKVNLLSLISIFKVAPYCLALPSFAFNNGQIVWLENFYFKQVNLLSVKVRKEVKILYLNHLDSFCFRCIFVQLAKVGNK